MLNLVDKALDQMTLPIQPSVVRTVSLVAFGRLMGRNDRFHRLFDDPIIESLGGITSVGNQMLKAKPSTNSTA